MTPSMVGRVTLCPPAEFGTDGDSAEPYRPDDSYGVHELDAVPGLFSFAQVRHRPGALVETPASGRVVVGRMFGLADVTSGGTTRRVAADEVFLPALPHVPAQLRWHRGHMQIVRIEPDVFAGVADLGPDDPVRITDLTPVSAAAARHCADAFAHLVDVVLPETDSPALIEAAARSLAAAVLATYPNTLS